jgi:hypothetical protein
MIHPGEGTLQALLDDELAGDERAGLERHLAECSECALELDALRGASAVFAAAVRLTDEAPQTEQARWRFEGRRRRGGGRGAAIALRRAAVLIVGSAAVLSATVPGSPLREWLVERWDRAVAVAPTADAPAAAPTAAVEQPTAAAAPAGVSVRPLDGRMRVVFNEPAAGVRLRVRLFDGERVGVWATGEATQAHFRTAPDRIEVDGVSAGEVRVEIPRAAREFTLEVNGRVYLRKDGEQLRFPGPAADTTGPEILFEVGS